VQSVSVEATLDKNRRYLVPVAALPIDPVPGAVHLSVYTWQPLFGAWLTSMSLCGASMRQGPLPDGATVTCPECEGWRPKYERMLAPGYRPEDDDPDALRRRAGIAGRQVAQARALVDAWRKTAAERTDAVIVVGVAADILAATLDGFNDLLGDGRH
jgi:hypothetical protein